MDLFLVNLLTVTVRIKSRNQINLFCPNTILLKSFVQASLIMRKLKGAVKETAKQKRERKQEFAKMRTQIHTIALPTCGVIFLLICVYVYLKTRPSNLEYS